MKCVYVNSTQNQQEVKMKSILLVISVFMVATCKPYIVLESQLNKDNSVILKSDCSQIKDGDSCIIYRSYQSLYSLGMIDLFEYPISKTVLKFESKVFSFKDTLLSDNCRYFYYVQIKTTQGDLIPSTICTVTTQNPSLLKNKNRKASILIDKKNYFLEISVDGIPVKRYPVNLGKRPWNRKLHFDQRSTPEGKYKVSHLNFGSLFHKSIGVNYPNNIDRVRYQNAYKNKKLPKINNEYAKIGGSITIHGGGVGNNWTWGCIAMRNSDIDEILSRVNVKPGVPIYIVGDEIRRKDLY